MLIRIELCKENPIGCPGVQFEDDENNDLNVLLGVINCGSSMLLNEQLFIKRKKSYCFAYLGIANQADCTGLQLM